MYNKKRRKRHQERRMALEYMDWIARAKKKDRLSHFLATPYPDAYQINTAIAIVERLSVAQKEASLHTLAVKYLMDLL